MAPLQIIGASFGRTGTDSLRTALETLGFRTHHMRVMFSPTENKKAELFTKAYENPNEDVDWDAMYKNYDAAVDWPTVGFLDRLILHYPNAKIILTLRDTEKWYASIKDTVAKVIENPKPIPGNTDEETLARERVREMSRTIIFDGMFKESKENMLLMDDKEDLIKAKYEAHIEWVKQNVPSDRLFIMELGEGWDRLCKFLDMPVPQDITYPHTNTKQMFIDRVLSDNKKEENSIEYH
ncbi:hypothetical protein INT45_011618 [Circinella minor]|uniref:P-loop containing nucleoside triphosphate hydrolase protein n=1 Tax=Circinella minor TaxID=1195481 RepID=A0A8H7S7C0_9FUNG|nr:hypothetical protein INT45_011618 [Circinella minor]